MAAFVILAGFALFALGLTSHLVAWRVFSIRQEMACLFGTFFGIPSFAFLAACLGGSIQCAEGAAIGLLWLALASAYVQTYPVLRHVIPSFRILLLLDQHRTAGLTADQLVDILSHEELFSGGLCDLENDSLIARDESGRYILTDRGARLAAAFAGYRRLLGVSPGLG